MGLNWQTDWGLVPTWMRANMSSTLCCQPGSDPGRVGPGWNQKLAQSWSEGHPHLVLIQLVLPPQLAIIKWLTGILHTSTGSSWATFDAPAIPAYYHQKVALFNIFGSKLIHLSSIIKFSTKRNPSWDGKYSPVRKLTQLEIWDSHSLICERVSENTLHAPYESPKLDYTSFSSFRTASTRDNDHGRRTVEPVERVLYYRSTVLPCYRTTDHRTNQKPSYHRMPNLTDKKQ